MEQLKQAAVSKIVIERPHKKCRVTIHSARPGVVIGKKGADIEKLRKKVAELTDSDVVHQHHRDQEARARRAAGRGIDRPAARASRCLPPRHEARRAVGDAARRRGHPHQLLRAGSAAPKSRAWSGIARAACRCTRCAPTSITASPPRSPPTAPAASRSGSSRARSWSMTRWPRTRRWRKATRAVRAATALTGPTDRRIRTKSVSHAATDAHQVPEGAQGPDQGHRHLGRRADLRPVRAQGAGAGARHRAPDRGGAARPHPSHEARGPGVDPHLPGRAGVEEAARSAHGLGQGHAGILGRPRQAGPDHVRDRWRFRWSSRARRSILPPPSCRSRRASSSALPSRWRSDR